MMKTKLIRVPRHVSSCVFCLSLCCCAGFSQSQSCDLPPQGIPVPSASAVAIGDVNSDGVLDLVSTSRNADTVSVFFGVGSLEWVLGGQNSVGETPTRVHLMDVNQDSHLDIVTVNLESNGFGDLSVLLNNGTGGFGTQTRVGTLQAPKHSAVADMNGDGVDDLVVVSQINGSVVVHSGVSPSLNATITIPGITSASHFDIGDIDNDGDPDLVVTRAAGTNNVQVFVNDGTGGFTNISSVSLALIPAGVAIIDANQDGSMDLVLPTLTGEIHSARGFGNGFFLLDQQYGAVPDVTQVESVDINDDGIDDLVLIDAGGINDPEEQITMLISDSGVALSTTKVVFTGSRAGGVGFAQIDGVGMLDLMAVSSSTNELRPIYSGVGNDFKAEERYEPGRRPIVALTGDVNNDGFLDIVTPNFGSNDLGVMLNEGDGTFDVLAAQPLGVSTSPSSGKLSDLNGDGNIDVILSSGNFVWFQLGDGTGQFGAPTVLSSIPPQKGKPDYGGEVLTEDVDLDGDIDIVWTLPPVNSINVFKNDGAGGFTFATQPTTGSWPDSYALGDLDGDGYPEIVHAFESQSLQWAGIAYSEAGSSFEGPVFIDIGQGSRRVYLEDLDLDGDLDLLVHGVIDSEVSIVENLGGRQFAPVVSLNTDLPLFFTQVTDVNQDGLPDLIFGAYQSSENQVYLNEGALVFSAGDKFSMGDTVRRMSAADLDGDGVEDLLVASSSHIDGDTVSVFLRTCNASSCIADLDMNGVLDFFDVSVFVNAFGMQDPAADLDMNGAFDFFDVSAFVNAYGAGCP